MELAASILRVLEVQKEYFLLVLDYLILKMAAARFPVNWYLFTGQRCIIRLHHHPFKMSILSQNSHSSFTENDFTLSISYF